MATQRRMNRKELDSSVHRLSRVKDQYKSKKAVQNERHESFVLNYYNKNPQEMDTRAPDEKLKDVQERLNDDDIGREERKRLLAQQKQLCYFAHGEDSSEMVTCERQLGMYYNRNKRPASAVRHLQKAQELQQTNKVDPEEGMEIAVEMAEANLAMRDANKRQETMKHMVQANKALKPVMGVEVDNLRLMYRRDLAQARVTTTRGRFEKALEQYETAAESLQRCSGSDNAEMANLYVEMADVAEADENEERAGQYYQMAYNKYINLGMDEEAKAIEPKLPRPEEEEVREASGVQSDGVMERDGEQRPNTPGDEEKKDKSSSSSSDSSKHEDKHSTASEQEKKSVASHHSDNEKKSEASHHSDIEKKSVASHHSDNEKKSEASHHSDNEKKSVASHHSDIEKRSVASHHSDNEKKSEVSHHSDDEKKSDSHHSDHEKKSDSHHSDHEKKSDASHHSDHEKKSDSHHSDHEKKSDSHHSDHEKKSDSHHSDHEKKSDSHHSDHEKKPEAEHAKSSDDEKHSSDHEKDHKSDHSTKDTGDKHASETDKKTDTAKNSDQSEPKDAQSPAVDEQKSETSGSSKPKSRHKHRSSRHSSAKGSEAGATSSEKPSN